MKPLFLTYSNGREPYLTLARKLNEIILPIGNQGEPEEDSYEIVLGEIYDAHGYKILPLDRRIYGAVPRDSKDACIIHYKGGGRTKKKKIR